jgi:hypothetical protein
MNAIDFSVFAVLVNEFRFDVDTIHQQFVRFAEETAHAIRITFAGGV